MVAQIQVSPSNRNVTEAEESSSPFCFSVLVSCVCFARHSCPLETVVQLCSQNSLVQG